MIYIYIVRWLYDVICDIMVYFGIALEDFKILGKLQAGF